MGIFKSKHAIAKAEDPKKEKEAVEFKGMKKTDNDEGTLTRGGNRGTLSRRQRFNKMIHDMVPWGKGGKDGVEEEITKSHSGGVHSAKPGGGSGSVLCVETAVQPIDDVPTSDDEAAPPGVVEIGAHGEPVILKHETKQERTVESTEEVLQNGAILETTTQITTKKTVIHMEQNIVNGDDNIIETHKQTVTYESASDKSKDAALLLQAYDKAQATKEDVEEAPVDEDLVQKVEAKKPVESEPPLLAEFQVRSKEEHEQELLTREKAYEEQCGKPPVELLMDGEVEEEEEEGEEIQEEEIAKSEAKKPEESHPIMNIDHVQASVPVQSAPVAASVPEHTNDSAFEEEIVQKQEVKKPQVEESGILAEFQPRSEEEQAQELRERERAIEEQSGKPAVELLMGDEHHEEEEEELPEIQEEEIGKTDAKKPEEAHPIMNIEVVQESSAAESQPPVESHVEEPIPPPVETPVEESAPPVEEPQSPVEESTPVEAPVEESAPAPVEAPVEEAAPAPVEEAVPAPVVAPVEESVPAPVEEAAPAPIETPVEEPAPAPVEAPVEEAAPAPVEAPVEEVAPAPVETPVEESVPAPVEAPVEETAPAPVETPVEESAPAPVETPVEEAAPAPVETPVEESVPAPVETPVEESQPPAESAPAESVPEEVPPPAEAAVVEEAAPPAESAPAEPEPTTEAAPAEQVEETQAPVEASPAESTPAEEPFVEKAESEDVEKAKEPSSAEVAEVGDSVAAAVMEEAVNEAAGELQQQDSTPEETSQAAAAPSSTEQPQEPPQQVPVESPEPDTPITSDVTDTSTESEATVQEPEAPAPEEPVSIPKTEIVWEHGGKHVVVLGSFDGWEEEFPLEESDGVFKTSIDLPPGRYEYKYKVDGEWSLSSSKESDGDNNVIVVGST